MADRVWHERDDTDRGVQTAQHGRGMHVVRDGRGRARITIDTYEDLLAVRSIPDYRFVGEREVDCDERHLHLLGHATATEAARPPLAGHLFDYQAWTVDLALARRRFAIFADTGLGKTAMQLEWAEQVAAVSGGRVLLVAPLNVVTQTIAEHERFYGEPITDCRERAALAAWLHDGAGLAITNYEKIDGTRLPVAGVVLDESSVLKQSMGARRTALMDAFKGVPWKLCCSATPAPNDRIEYAEHAFFLDVVRSTREFLAAFFVNRDGQWQLKYHGEQSFYRHLAAWSVFMRDPAAYGFDDLLANMPPLSVEFPRVPLTPQQVEAARGWQAGAQQNLLGVEVGGVTSRTKVMQIAHGFELEAA